MTHSKVTQQIIRQLDQLSPELQRRVLDFVLALSQPQGTPGEQLLRFAGVLEPDDAQAMTQAIETNCERIDADGW
jgi:hypothetical protein